MSGADWAIPEGLRVASKTAKEGQKNSIARNGRGSLVNVATSVTYIDVTDVLMEETVEGIFPTWRVSTFRITRDWEG